MDNNFKDEYSRVFSEASFWEKIRKYAKAAGLKVIYTALLLYYTLQKSTTPSWAKAVIAGALGYFIFPIDAIIDITPVIGYTDDYGVLVLALAQVAMFIDGDIKKQARAKIETWFGNTDLSELEEVDNKTS